MEKQKKRKSISNLTSISELTSFQKYKIIGGDGISQGGIKIGNPTKPKPSSTK